MKLVFVRNKLPLILVFIFMVISTIANVNGLNTIQKVLDEGLRLFETGSSDFSGVMYLLLTMIMYYVLNIVFTFMHLRLMVHVSQNSLVHIRTSLFDHMMDLPLKYFDTNKHGDIMSRFTNDVDATRQMVSQSLPQLTVSLLLMIGYFIAMVSISWILGIFTFVFAVILIIITRVISKKTRKYFDDQQRDTGILNGYI
ncbi:MAG TPA: ABC transporter ATP-binding protein, partial [Acholeplasmataceae bacterium]|nr:ABC transporter ATP-binding protein [Acholeplasmataceae bacterium]